MKDKKDRDKKEDENLAIWIGVGMSLGSCFGLLMNNIGLGIAIGTSIGIAIGSMGLSDKKK